MSDNIVHVTDASFDGDVLQSEQPVLVDFWADTIGLEILCGLRRRPHWSYVENW